MLKRGDVDGNSKKSTERLKWDEEAIAEHDKERGTRQKIDEPPTPYEYGSDEEDDSDAQGVVSDIGDGMINSGALENWELVRAKLLHQKLEMESGAAHTESNSNVTGGMVDHDDGCYDGYEENDFKNKRAAHDNELQLMRAMREKNEVEESDEDESV